MSNSIAYADIFQTVLDEMMVQDAVTGWMEANAGQVIYNGGKTVKIPKLSMSGLGNYGRPNAGNGYPMGDVSLEYETRTMTQDRGRQLTIDAMDVNEANFVPTASLISSEFQRVAVVPEIDAYRLSALATMAITADESCEYSYTPAAATIVAKLEAAIAAVKKAGFRNVPLVIHARTDVVTALETAVGDKLRAQSFAQGGIDLSVPSFNGYPIIETDDERMVSAIQIKTDGWQKGASAIDINFMVIPRSVPIAVSKQDKVKIFSPDQNQDADAWKIDYRRYHDIWAMDNKIAGIACNFAGAKPASESGDSAASGASA